MRPKTDGPGRHAIFLGVFNGDHSSGIPFAAFRGAGITIGEFDTWLAIYRGAGWRAGMALARTCQEVPVKDKIREVCHTLQSNATMPLK